MIETVVMVDADLLYLLDAGPRAAHRPYLGARLSHALPFVDGLDTETLLNLRSEEGEAFLVYRDGVRTLVDDTTLSENEFREGCRDLVQPELNKIDHAVAAPKRMVRGAIREKLVLGTGLVTIGLAAGAASPEAGAIVSAFGGAKFGAELLSSLNALLREPETTCRNDLYFIWNARQSARHGARANEIIGIWVGSDVSYHTVSASAACAAPGLRHIESSAPLGRGTCGATSLT